MRILIRSDPSGEWRPVDSVAYELEAELQQLIADSPSLVPIQDIHEGVRPFVASVREFGLPGSGYTDVILLNPDGHIGVIECKLAVNEESKRKVIGQVFEYGAYLWEMAYDEFDQRVQARAGRPLADLMSNRLADESWDEERFRSTVTEVLQSGAFTLVIAVDRINDELERTVRFLNQRGGSSFSLAALELRRFQSGGNEILVPHLFGPLESRSGAVAVSGARRVWTEATLFEEFEKLSPEPLAVIRDLYDWTQANADRVWFGQGRVTGSFSFHTKNPEGAVVSPFTIYTDGKLQVNFGYLDGRVLDDDLEAFRQALVSIPSLRGLKTTGYPLVIIADVFGADAEAVAKFKTAVLEVCARARTG